MRERPLLVSTPLVPKLLDDSKTQTRRIIKPGLGLRFAPGVSQCFDPESAADRTGMLAQCPYGVVGDRLWVRESFSPWTVVGVASSIDSAGYVVMRDGGQMYRRYEARGGRYIPPQQDGYAPGAFDHIKWRPSIHMPRWASRITLEITSVRIQRLQDITAEDAIAEGATWTDYGRRCLHVQDTAECESPAHHHPQRNGWSMFTTTSDAQCLASPCYAFANAWNHIHGGKNWNLKQDESPWDLNPWVWAIGFRRIAQEARAA